LPSPVRRWRHQDGATPDTDSSNTTRIIEYMAWTLQHPLIGIANNEDIAASEQVGH